MGIVSSKVTMESSSVTAPADSVDHINQAELTSTESTETLTTTEKEPECRPQNSSLESEGILNTLGINPVEHTHPNTGATPAAPADEVQPMVNPSDPTTDLTLKVEPDSNSKRTSEDDATEESPPASPTRKRLPGKYQLNPKPEIMVFRPTWEEFKDFNKYIAYMEEQGAHLAGIAKVIPPPEFKPRKSGKYDDISMTIEPIRQTIFGKAGYYSSIYQPSQPMTVAHFRSLAESEENLPPQHANFDELEHRFWRDIAYRPPLYGADTSGTLTDPDYPYWNFNKLGSILDIIQNELNCDISGVNTPYLYFGMWKSCFAWHTEDLDLYSINYLHYGAPKSWYGIPPAYAQRFEELAARLYLQHSGHCDAFLRHKTSFISPNVLKSNFVPYGSITQNEGEIIITFPYGYHSGFNHGYNIAEAVNFATPRWVEYGKRATLCDCRDDSVRIDMEPFIRRFQPDRYDLWMEGKDFGRHPEQQTGRSKPAPKRKADEEDLKPGKKTHAELMNHQCSKSILESESE